MRIAFAFLVCTAALAATAARIDGVQILPANPVAGEDFLVEVDLSSGTSPITVTGVEVVSSGTAITLNVAVADSGVDVGARARAILNRSAGTYQLLAQTVSGTFVFRVPLTITVSPATTVSPQFRNATALWWNPAEPGSAVNVTQGESGKLFALWYTYYPTNANPGDGSNMWLVMSDGRWTTPTEFRGLVYWAMGTPVNLPFNANLARLIPAGVATLRLNSADQLEFEVDASMGTGLGRITKKTTLQRYRF